MNKSAIFLLGGALLSAPLGLAYDQEEEEVEEVVVTAPRLPSGSMPSILAPNLPLVGPHGDELRYFRERGERSAETISAACETAKQDAMARGAGGSIFAGVAIACRHIKNDKANAACQMAVAFAAGVCLFGSPGGSNND